MDRKKNRDEIDSFGGDRPLFCTHACNGTLGALREVPHPVSALLFGPVQEVREERRDHEEVRYPRQESGGTTPKEGT